MPKEEHHYYVYILASRSRTLYIGVTNQLVRRIGAHRDGSGSAFTTGITSTGRSTLSTSLISEWQSAARNRSRDGCGQKRLL
ncbi:GIY-YIG nuclease family protein [Terriglobus albidus]|uniref:GIY-YIG nuclease family protein n=1 Tax=Terriglobus albidus TaxID=1592106 RepID=UPI001FE322B0|nr:GIY-YIG nuclease family protein [Terriglobus albidus]